MLLSILLFCAALASTSPIQSAAPAPPLPSVNSIGAASSISSVMASPSFIPYSKPTEDVVEWIALGDSFTAGTGCNGNAEVFAGDAIRGQRSFPMQMKTDSDGWDFINIHGGGVPPRFSFSAYTGDTTAQLITDQLKAGAYTATNYNLPRHPFGAPQLAVLTIGGNDAYLSEIINNCLYRFWADSCDDSLNKLQSDLTNGIFKDKISYALYETARFGRQQGGANPRDSFQVYVSEYIPFFDETTTACNDYSWGWFTSDHKLTQDLRKRLNSLTNQVNSVIQDAAKELERLGVIFVSGIASQYISGGHQFCADGHDTNKEMLDKNTWFWSQYQPTGSDTEGPDAITAATAFNNTVLQSVLDFAYGKGKTTPEAYPSSIFYNSTSEALTPYKSFDDLLNAMADSPVEEYTLVPLQVKRSMHPKGTAFGIHKDAFMAAIADNRGEGTSSSTPPPAADQCGDWYKFLFDSFQIYGKNFDPSKIGTDGSGLKHQLSGCGVLENFHFNNVTGDPHGYQWYATGTLPIGTKACVGRAVVSAGGASPDGCTGAG